MKPDRIAGRILTADAINRCNTFDAPDAVQPAAFDGAKIRGDLLQISLPPKSVVTLMIE
jgi:alpha-N-arabinofuranosidase